MRKKAKFIIFTIAAVSVMVLNLTCERPTSAENPNQAPNTTMANIPSASDTLFALLTLHWDGEDFDGYIKGFQYRYITHRLFIGDSIVQPWKDTNSTSLTIAFLSDDQLNRQTFQVRAIDNNGEADPTPAEKQFYTVQTIFPRTSILYPEDGGTYYVGNEVTDWWQGIRLDYVGSDQDGSIVEYAWSVDGGEWTWTEDTSVVITPDQLSQPLAGEHYIQVKSRDNTNLVDPAGDSIVVTLVNPRFDRKMLVIDATQENNMPAGLSNKPSDADVDSFYAAVFPGSDQWDFSQKGFPPVDTLGRYRAIVWHSDHLPFSSPHGIYNYTDQIADYLNVGGNIIIGGWRILKSFAWTDNFPIVFDSESFVNEYLHIVSVDETGGIGDMTDMRGLGSVYPDASIDSVKLAGFPYDGMLGNVNMILLPGGFTDGIYFYDNKPNSPNYEHRGKTIGLRYYGTVFQAAVFGLPLYFLEIEDAKVMANTVMTQMGIN